MDDLFLYVKASKFFPAYAPSVKNMIFKLRGKSSTNKEINFTLEDRETIARGLEKMTEEYMEQTEKIRTGLIPLNSGPKPVREYKRKPKDEEDEGTNDPNHLICTACGKSVPAEHTMYLYKTSEGTYYVDSHEQSTAFDLQKPFHAVCGRKILTNGS